MYSLKKIIICIYLVFLVSSIDAENFVSEQFNNLDRWEVLKFPKIRNTTKYIIEEGQYLRIESNNSASGLKMKSVFNVYKYPVLSWRWKVSNIIDKADPRKKQGDDYPVRIYVVFKYDPNTANFGEKIQYSAIKLLYGEFPPQATLNYIWSNKNLNSDFIFSPYTKKVIMIPMDEGEKKLDTWQTHRVNILDDYRKVFGSDPPEIASLAIMGDSDNTGEKTLAFIDFIELKSE